MSLKVFINPPNFIDIKIRLYKRNLQKYDIYFITHPPFVLLLFRRKREFKKPLLCKEGFGVVHIKIDLLKIQISFQFI